MGSPIGNPFRLVPQGADRRHRPLRGPARPSWWSARHRVDRRSGHACSKSARTRRGRDHQRPHRSGGPGRRCYRFGGRLATRRRLPTLVRGWHRGCRRSRRGRGRDVPVRAFFGDQGRHNRSITTFFLLACTNLGPDLSWLADRVATDTLDPNIAWRGDWTQVGEAAQALLSRRLHDKAVLELR